MPLLVVGLLVAVRFPAVWHRMGGQDEQWYAVPGWTVAREGIPRIPYAPVEDPQSVFNGAHEAVFALPPAFFYVQAPFFWILPAGYGTARLASLLAGGVLLLLLYRLLRCLDVPRDVSLAALVMCALGRAFLFPWQDARPDMLCAMFGVAAILCTLMGLETGRRTFVALAGLATGLGLLTHPFALVYTLQVGGLLLLSDQPLRRRVGDCFLSGAFSVAGLSLWGPLIALDPAMFWTQFSNNVLSRSGPGIVGRLLWPWEFVPFQASLMLDRIGPLQAILAVTTLVAGLFFWRSRQTRLTWYLAMSAIYLHIASIGQHPAKGYLCYTWAILVLLLARVVDDWSPLAPRMLAGRDDDDPQHESESGSLGVLPQSEERSSDRARGTPIVLSIVVILLLVPGSGLRASWVYLTRWRQPEYDARQFCEQLADRLPESSQLIVAPEFVFEFERLGRQPVNASINATYHTVEGLPFDLLVVSRQSLDEGIPEQLHARLIETVGHPDDPLACYAEIYVPTEETPVDRPWPRD